MSSEQPFEETLEKFRPLIFHIMNILHIYKDKDEYFQIAVIALWKAAANYDEKKGSFSTYAYWTIKGMLLSQLKKDRIFSERHVLKEMGDKGQSHFLPQDNIEFEMLIDRLACCLSPNQQIWLEKYCFEGKTPKEIAEELHVTVGMVKNWRRGALNKIRKLRRHFERS